MLTVKQVADRLAVSIATVYGLCAAGRLRHVRIGIGRGAIRVSEADLEQFLDEKKVGTGGASAPPVLLPFKRPLRLRHIRL